MAGLNRPQRYARHDPAPHLMFEEQKAELCKPMSKLEWLLYVALASVIAYSAYLVGGIK